MSGGVRLLTGRRLIWLAGIALVILGIICLYLSDAVIPPGSWWQGTLDAFGVGFVVGGIVDVVSISLLNQVLTRASQQPWNSRAMEILASIPDPYSSGGYDPELEDAAMVLARFGDKLDPVLRRGLEERLEQTDWKKNEDGIWNPKYRQ